MTTFNHIPELNGLASFLENLNGKMPGNFDTLVANIQENRPGTITLISHYPAVFKTAPVIQAIAAVADADRLNAFAQLLIVDGIENLSIDGNNKIFVDLVCKVLQEIPEYIPMAAHSSVGKDPKVAETIARLAAVDPSIQEVIDHIANIEAVDPIAVDPGAGDGWQIPDPVH